MDNKKYGMAELLAEFGDQFDKYEEQHAEKQDEVVEEPEKPEEEKQQEHKPEVLKDITIKCKKCEKDWIWTVKDQEFYKEKGFFRPAYCKECRKKTKVVNNFHKV